MTYEAWRISYQSSEQAARAAYAKCAQLHVRLESAEKERDWNAARLGEAIEELTALRARIEKMEKQEPLWFIDERGEPKRYHKSKADYCKYGGLDLLYALPGAKGE